MSCSSRKPLRPIFGIQTLARQFYYSVYDFSNVAINRGISNETTRSTFFPSLFKISKRQPKLELPNSRPFFGQEINSHLNFLAATFDCSPKVCSENQTPWLLLINVLFLKTLEFFLWTNIWTDFWKFESSGDLHVCIVLYLTRKFISSLNIDYFHESMNWIIINAECIWFSSILLSVVK